MSKTEQPSALKKRLKFAAQLVVALLISSFLVLSDDQRAAIAQALSDPFSVLADRSPGTRDGAKLRQTKVRHEKGRHEVVLPVGENLLSPERVMDPSDINEQPPVFTEDAVGPLAYNSPAPTPGTGTNPGGHRFPGGGGFGPGLVGGGNPGGTGGGDNCTDKDGCSPPDPVDPTPPVVAIPEPTTWLMAIAGFFALGFLLRRKPTAPAKAADADLGQQHSS